MRQPGDLRQLRRGAGTIGGNLPQAYRDYILQTTVGTTKFRETIVSGTLNGDLFELPGGAVQVVVGAEYRAQKIDDTPGDMPSSAISSASPLVFRRAARTT